MMDQEVPALKTPTDETFLWEPGNPAERSQHLGEAKKPKNRHTEEGKKNSFHLTRVTPHPRRHSSVPRETPSAHNLSHGDSESKWAPNCPSLEGCCRGRPLLPHPTQNWGNQHSWLGFRSWHTDLNTSFRPYWLACGQRKVWRRKSKSVDYLYAIKVKLFLA